MTGIHLTIQGIVSTTIHSDIILTLQMTKIQIFWEGILTVKANGRVAILHQNSLDEPGRGGGGSPGFTLTHA